MLCRKPYRPRGQQAHFPCGQCESCRSSRGNLWASRMMLEAFFHEKSCFVTLTYDPNKYNASTLLPSHCTKFIKRVRKAIAPQKLRYFLVGEYGSSTERPHYHLAIFGLGIEDESLLSDKWPMGFIQVGDLTIASAKYMTKYIVKNFVDPDKLCGRHPEFARMSQGLGKQIIPYLVDVLKTEAGSVGLKNTIDVPTYLQTGKSHKMYLGRYLRTKLREALDIFRVHPVTGEVKYGWSKASEIKCAEEMSLLFENYKNDPQFAEKPFWQYLSYLDKGSADLLRTRIEHTNLKRKI